MRKLNILLYYAFALFFVPNALAQSQTSDPFSKLFNNEYRPTVAEVLAEVREPLPESAKYNSVVNLRHNNLIQQHLPTLIAQLEFHFPDGTFVALGRDAVYIADLLEAFYLSQGITGRVYRLHASSPTIDEIRRKGKMLDFLMSNGLTEKTKSYVVIDRTSFSENSQSNYVYKAIFNFFKSLGFSDKKIIREKAAIASTISGHPSSDYKTLVHQRVAPLYIGDGTSFTDYGYWNESYTADLITYPDGSIRGGISANGTASNKREVLELIMHAVKIINTPEFLMDVQDEYRKISGGNELVLKKPDEIQNSATAALAKLQADAKTKGEAAQLEENTRLNLAKLDKDLANAKAVLIDALAKHLYGVQKISTKYDYQPEKISNVTENFSEFSSAQLLPLYNLIIGAVDEFLKSERERSIKSNNMKIIESEMFVRFKLILERNLASLQPVEYLLFDLIQQSGPNANEEKYFSDHGLMVKAYLEKLSKSPYGMQHISQSTLYKAIIHASYASIISKKDVRRIFLYALSILASDANALLNFSFTLYNNPDIRAVIIKYSDVFLTSERYDKMARQAYLQLVELNALPKIDDITTRPSVTAADETNNANAPKIIDDTTACISYLAPKSRFNKNPKASK